MATARNILKNYFLTGKKPSQGQFAALIDSFLHLSEDSLSITQIQNLQDVLAGKASTAQIEALMEALNTKEDKQNKLISGGETTYTGTTLTVQPADWEINGIAKQKTTITEFTGVNLSASGKQRWVLIYGTINNTILKIEGDEDDIGVAIKPNLPANTVLIGELLISDDVAEIVEPDLSKFATKDELANSIDFFGLTTGTGTTYVVTPKQKRTTPISIFNEIRLQAHTPNTSETFTLRLRIRNGATRDYFFPVLDKNGLNIPIGMFKGDMIIRYNPTSPKSWRVLNIDSTAKGGATGFADLEGMPEENSELNNRLTAINNSISAAETDQITLKIFKISNYGTL